jgi:hypothetical protein
MDGGDGYDILLGTNFLSGTSWTSAIDVNLTTGLGQGSLAGCTFAGFEQVVGTNFNDIQTANLNIGTKLTGANGNDTLNGANGDDILNGDNSTTGAITLQVADVLL